MRAHGFIYLAGSFYSRNVKTLLKSTDLSTCPLYLVGLWVGNGFWCRSKMSPFTFVPHHLKAACGFPWLSPQTRCLLHLVCVERRHAWQAVRWSPGCRGPPQFFSSGLTSLQWLPHPITLLSPEAFFAVRWILVHLSGDGLLGKGRVKKRQYGYLNNWDFDSSSTVGSSWCSASYSVATWWCRGAQLGLKLSQDLSYVLYGRNFLFFILAPYWVEPHSEGQSIRERL